MPQIFPKHLCAVYIQFHGQLQADSKSMIWFFSYLCSQKPYELVAKGHEGDILHIPGENLFQMLCTILMFPFCEGTGDDAHNWAESHSVTLQVPFQSCHPICQLAYENELNWFLFCHYSNNSKSTALL